MSYYGRTVRRGKELTFTQITATDADGAVAAQGIQTYRIVQNSARRMSQNARAPGTTRASPMCRSEAVLRGGQGRAAGHMEGEG